jgi:hypothetical protein
MSNILPPGYLRWDGTKYVLDSDIEIVGPPGPLGPVGPVGPAGPPGTGVLVDIVVVDEGLLEWIDPDVDPRITQVNLITDGGTGHTLTIQAQNETGTNSQGGTVTLQSGTGTNNDGYIDFLIGTNNLGRWDIVNNLATFISHEDREGIFLKADTNTTIEINKETSQITLTCVNGDVTLSPTANVILNGTTLDINTSTIQSGAPQFIFDNNLSTCKISQANRTSDGYDLTIQAQNATGAGTTGGDLVLTSGTGVTANGQVLIKVGSVNKFEAGTSVTTVSGVSIFIESDTQISFSAAGGLMDISDTAFNVNVNGTCEILGTTINLNNITINATTNTTISFAAFLNSCTILQADDTNNSAVGKSLTVHAQNATGTTSTGGELILASGTGTSTRGNITFKSGTTNALKITPSVISVIYNFIRWDVAAASPGILQEDNTTNSGTGATLNIQAQNATGAGSSGGSLVLASGGGTSVDGSLILRTGSTTRFTANTNGIAFYNGSPVAQQTRAGQLTNTNGTGSSTIANVGSSFNQTTLNNIIRSLSDKYNALETIIHNLRLST